MRLIDADSLDKALTSLRFTADGELAHWGDRKDWCLHGREIEMLIANAPTVEAEPIRHGEWMRKEDEYAYWYECSECGDYPLYEHDVRVFSRYCPNCGAHMHKGET